MSNVILEKIYTHFQLLLGNSNNKLHFQTT